MYNRVEPVRVSHASGFCMLHSVALGRAFPCVRWDCRLEEDLPSSTRKSLNYSLLYRLCSLSKGKESQMQREKQLERTSWEGNETHTRRRGVVLVTRSRRNCFVQLPAYSAKNFKWMACNIVHRAQVKALQEKPLYINYSSFLHWLSIRLSLQYNWPADMRLKELSLALRFSFFALAGHVLFSVHRTYGLSRGSRRQRTTVLYCKASAWNAAARQPSAGLLADSGSKRSEPTLALVLSIISPSTWLGGYSSSSCSYPLIKSCSTYIRRERNALSVDLSSAARWWRRKTKMAEKANDQEKWPMLLLVSAFALHSFAFTS